MDLGLMEADAYLRAADVLNVRVSNLLSGRALESHEIAHWFRACAADTTPKGIRDAAMLAALGYVAARSPTCWGR